MLCVLCDGVCAVCVQCVRVCVCCCMQAESGEWVIDEEQTVRLKADFIISAFGSELHDQTSETTPLLTPLPLSDIH